jgi:hypothetical protein
MLMGLAMTSSSCQIPKALYVHLADPVTSPGFREKGEFKAEGNLQPKQLEKSADALFPIWGMWLMLQLITWVFRLQFGTLINF